MNSPRSSSLSNYLRSNVLGLVAIFLSLTAGAYAVATAPKNSVVSSSIKNGQVKTRDLADSAVSAAKVKPNALTGAQINESTLTGVDAATLGGSEPSTFPSQLSDVNQGTLSATPSGTNATLFGGAVPDFGTFVFHCETSASAIHLAANSSQLDLSVFSRDINGNANSVVATGPIDSTTGYTIDLTSPPNVLVWQLSDGTGVHVATLTFSFAIGDVAADECSYRAQLLIGQVGAV
jgi:hypothetical protein